MAKTPLFERGAVVKNYIINGALDHWQRGTSSSAQGYVTVDRFLQAWSGDGGTPATITLSQQSVPLGTIEGDPIFCARVTNGTQGTSLGANSFYALVYRVEDVRSLAGKKATLSFWAKSTITAKSVNVIAFQVFGSGGSAQVNLTGKLVTLTSGWARYSVTFTIPSLTGKTIGSNSFLGFALDLQQGATDAAAFGVSAVAWQGTGDTDFTAFMLNEGTEAAPFTRQGGDAAGELRLCKRFYEAISWDTIQQVDAVPNAKALAYLKFEVQKRVAPTVNVAVTRTAGAFLNSQVHYSDANIVVYRSASTSAGSLYEYGATLTADAEI